MKQRRLLKKLLIKLGTNCNLGCAHCHQTQKTFVEHPRLLEWIKENNFDRITFSGGEPLMYFDTIKRYMTYLGPKIQYRMMSNTTLLTPEMADFFNKYKMSYGVSFDGTCGGRDLTIPIKWESLNHMKSWGMCTIFSDPNFSFRGFAKEVQAIFEKYNLQPWTYPEFYKINWIHQTPDAPNVEFTKEVADRFIEQVTKQLDQAFYYHSKRKIDGSVLKNLISRWYSIIPSKHGVACCSETLMSVNLDGTLMLCPYGSKAIGTIDNPPSLEDIDQFVPEKCKGCEHWRICKCSCVAAVTDLDCYVNKTMIPKVKELIEKYNYQQVIDQLLPQPND